MRQSAPPGPRLPQNPRCLRACQGWCSYAAYVVLVSWPGLPLLWAPCGGWASRTGERVIVLMLSVVVVVVAALAVRRGDVARLLRGGGRRRW